MSKLNVLGLGLILVVLPTMAQQKAPKAVAKVERANSLAVADQGETQQKLLALLPVSPTLAHVVADDPTILSDREYVSRYNPEVAQFLQEHSEVVPNPQFYVRSDLREQGHRNYQLLNPKTGFTRSGPRPTPGLEVDGWRLTYAWCSLLAHR